MKRITPVVLVDEIEPHLPFWEALGFERMAEIPTGDALGFVGLGRGDAELMLQSRASLAADIPEIVPEELDHSGFSLFVEIDMPFEELTERIAKTDAEVIVPDRHTFYGAREIVVRSQGVSVVFASFEEEGESA